MIVLHSVGVTATGAERHLLSGQWLLQGREKAKMEIYMYGRHKQEERMDKRQSESKHSDCKYDI